MPTFLTLLALGPEGLECILLPYLPCACCCCWPWYPGVGAGWNPGVGAGWKPLHPGTGAEVGAGAAAPDIGWVLSQSGVVGVFGESRLAGGSNPISDQAI